MDKLINIMVNGLPGNVARKMAAFAHTNSKFNLVPYSLTGQDIEEDSILFDTKEVKLIKPDERSQVIETIKKHFGQFIVIDYTHPTAVNDNALFYIKCKTPFVMGTTGGDRQKLLNDVDQSDLPAVIAPNMAKQIVGFQAMMEYGAKNFPGLFKDFSLKIKESHQQAKADTSGTAKAMVEYFNLLGVDFSSDQIEKERNPDIQRDEWKIPKEYLSGHGWHTYTLEALDKSSLFEFKHNINGRDIYVNGTFDAVDFLHNIIQNPENYDKTLFNMIDVLKG